MQIRYINANGAELTLRQRKPYFLTKIDGAGEIKQSITTFKAPDQDGVFYISSTLDMRNITLEGTVVAGTPDEAYVLRRTFLQVFSPKLKGMLIYRSRQISCIVEEAGFTVNKKERIPNFFVSLLCPSPFFEDISELRQELASWDALLEFPLEITSPGVEFGLRQPSQIITVENYGDVSCGCEIVFSATGTVTNPELLNMDSNEFIRLLTTMDAGDEFHIYTHFANKKVTSVSEGTETNAFNLLDTNSVFFQLHTSMNTLRFDAATNMDLLEVAIYFRPLYLGV